jgi:hypothetical protein
MHYGAYNDKYQLNWNPKHLQPMPRPKLCQIEFSITTLLGGTLYVRLSFIINCQDHGDKNRYGVLGYPPGSQRR